MRFVTSILLFTVAALAVDNLDVYTVDCDSAKLDPALTPATGATADKCKTSCKTACASVKSEADAKKCLASASMDGCLVDMSRIHDVETTSCTTGSSDSAKGPTLVFGMKDADVKVMGDRSKVRSVSLLAALKDAPNVSKCTDKRVKIGIATTADTSDAKCSATGGKLQDAEYSINGQNLAVDLTKLFATVGFDKAVNLYAIFQDKSCAALALKDAFKDVEIEFQVTYSDGYRPSTNCAAQTGCNECKAKGCLWCGWSKNSGSAGWLLDWDFTDNARDDGKGLCGINSAICSQTRGDQNKCTPASTPAPAPSSVSAKIAAAAGLVSFLTLPLF